MDTRLNSREALEIGKLTPEVLTQRFRPDERIALH